MSVRFMLLEMALVHAFHPAPGQSEQSHAYMRAGSSRSIERTSKVTAIVDRIKNRSEPHLQTELLTTA